MKRGKGTRQQGKGQRGCVSRVKGLEGNGKDKGLRSKTDKEKQWNGTEGVKGMEGIGSGSRALGKGYKTHGCHESEDVWQPCGR